MREMELASHAGGVNDTAIGLRNIDVLSTRRRGRDSITCKIVSSLPNGTENENAEELCAMEFVALQSVRVKKGAIQSPTPACVSLHSACSHSCRGVDRCGNRLRPLTCESISICKTIPQPRQMPRCMSSLERAGGANGDSLGAGWKLSLCQVWLPLTTSSQWRTSRMTGVRGSFPLPAVAMSE